MRRSEFISKGVIRLNFMVLFLGIISLFMTSCNRPTETPGEFHSLPHAEWPYPQQLVFNERGDTILGDVKAVELFLRHSKEYPYANIWLELSYNSADSVVADTFNVVVADEYGKWLGSGAGPLRLLTDTLRLRNMPDADSKFRLRHIMRVEILPEIEQVGIKYLTDK